MDISRVAYHSYPLSQCLVSQKKQFSSQFLYRIKKASMFDTEKINKAGSHSIPVIANAQY